MGLILSAWRAIATDRHRGRQTIKARIHSDRRDKRRAGGKGTRRRKCRQPAGTPARDHPARRPSLRDPSAAQTAGFHGARQSAARASVVIGRGGGGRFPRRTPACRGPAGKKRRRRRRGIVHLPLVQIPRLRNWRIFHPRRRAIWALGLFGREVCRRVAKTASVFLIDHRARHFGIARRQERSKLSTKTVILLWMYSHGAGRSSTPPFYNAAQFRPRALDPFFADRHCKKSRKTKAVFVGHSGPTGRLVSVDRQGLRRTRCSKAPRAEPRRRRIRHRAPKTWTHDP